MSDDKREALAALEHDQWAHWTRYMLTVLGPVLGLGFYEANWALFALASARFLKALLAVLKNTKQALSGYRKYQVHELRQGRTVVLRQITAGSTQDVAEDPAAK